LTTGSPKPSPAPQPDASLRFAQACAFVVDRLEGGDKVISDSGGLTRFGISQRAFPDLDIARLTREQAFELYRLHYWQAVQADRLPVGIDLLVFDAAVNLGPETAVRLLQRVLRVREDGKVGPETLVAAEGFLPGGELRALYSEIRLRHYEDLVRLRPVHTPSLYGWRLRVMRVADEAGRRA
jgi:lysozyme family protein